MNRQALAEHVGRLISSERNVSHGDPHKQFACQQRLWMILVEYGVENLEPSARHALQLDTTKTSRIVCGKNLQEHWLDKAGYALIAAEHAEEPLEGKKEPTIDDWESSAEPMPLNHIIPKRKVRK